MPEETVEAPKPPASADIATGLMARLGNNGLSAAAGEFSAYVQARDAEEAARVAELTTALAEDEAADPEVPSAKKKAKK